VSALRAGYGETIITPPLGTDLTVFGFEIEAAEPIGFNRRRRSFEEIDPWLKVAVLR